MIDIKGRWDNVTDRGQWTARGASLVAKVKATKVVWFPPEPLETGARATAAATKATKGATSKSTGAAKKATKKSAGTAKKSTSKSTGAAKKATKKSTGSAKKVTKSLTSPASRKKS
jgi:hypothetical protein